MQYYTFKLDEESQDLCIIITPVGKFKYKRLQMVLKCAPDFSQQAMENVLWVINNSEVHLDEIGCFSNEWKHHLKLLDQVLIALQTNGFTINPRKCKWATQETDWLGYWITPNGLKPWHKKIEVIMQIDQPKNLKQMRGFLGAVSFYRDILPQQAHLLTPLSKKSINKSFHWTD